jgi:ornithine--oxo-acid transaminase
VTRKAGSVFLRPPPRSPPPPPPPHTPQFDFLSGYSALNMGHCHPALVATMQEQCATLTLVSRAFYSDKFAPFAEYLLSVMGYDRMLPMNTGVEAGESAMKLARRWAYRVKGVPDGQALMLFAHGNFWGRTLGAISSSDDPESTADFGPLLPGYLKVPYDDLGGLEAMLEQHGHRLAAFMVEPVQGEAGVVVPQPGYLAAAQALCKKHNVLLIADEVQTGLGRTGKMLCSDWDGVKPDILLLGKALSGGMMPVSAVLFKEALAEVFTPGSHGSTFGGNPLACAVAHRSVRVIVEEKLAEAARVRGEQARSALRGLVEAHPDVVKSVRGRGLLNAVVMSEDARDKAGRPLSAWDVCVGLRDAGVKYGAPAGLLAKPTHGNIIRFAPPLIISEEQHALALETVRHVVGELVAGNR